MSKKTLKKLSITSFVTELNHKGGIKSGTSDMAQDQLTVILPKEDLTRLTNCNHQASFLRGCDQGNGNITLV